MLAGRLHQLHISGVSLIHLQVNHTHHVRYVTLSWFLMYDKEKVISVSKMTFKYAQSIRKYI